MHSYFIYLENEHGQKGYHGLVMSVDPPDYRVLKYACSEMQVGFSSHSRSNSYHAGDKSGRRARSRRSPDFCIRYASGLRLVGELKYVSHATAVKTKQGVHELRDYLSIKSEPTSDWGTILGTA